MNMVPSADDDTLDGWLILQRRKREQGDRQRKADGVLTNERIKNSDEVFIVVDSDDDARDVEALNDPHAQAVKAQRLAHLARHGTVHEGEMPDARLAIQMQYNRLKAQGQ